jgi:hypothetical protein
MKKLIITLIFIPLILMADNVKTDLVVTFKGLTLEQAAKIEKIIREDFSDYQFEITLDDGISPYPNYWWGDGGGYTGEIYTLPALDGNITEEKK